MTVAACSRANLPRMKWACASRVSDKLTLRCPEYGVFLFDLFSLLIVKGKFVWFESCYCLVVMAPGRPALLSGITMKTLDDRIQPSGNEKSSGRRRFVRGLGVALPVTLTVSARSAMAATCTTVSAQASIDLANSHNSLTDVNQPCAALSPATWAGREESEFGVANVNFSSQFGGGPNKTMRKVLRDPNATAFQKHIAAAYVNSVHGKVGTKFYDIDKLKAMWNWKQGHNGFYQPLPGANWDEADIMRYLADTWS